MAALLIPRAVAYSAGFINYFFRGRLEIDDVSEIEGSLRIQVRNMSGADFPLKNGTFTLYYDAPDGTRRPLAITQNATVSVLAHDQYLVLTAQKPKLSEVDLSKDTPLTLVFRGTVGEEEAVAGAVLEMPLSGFIVSPNYIPADGIAGPRHIYFEDGQWKLNSRTDLVAGNIDWKGWYVNGKPTKVLTWWGPHARYSQSRGGFSGDEIYHNGRLFARAPSIVLGAALARDAAGRTWLIAVCAEGETEVVYRRPAKRSDSAERYDPVTQPDGWEEIGRYSGPPGSTFAPWFFNGSGTEAQTVRPGSNLVPGGGSRHRLTIEPGSLNTAQFETLENAAGWRGERHNSGVDSDIVLRPKEWHCRSYRAHTNQSTSENGASQGRDIVAVDYRDGEARPIWKERTEQGNISETYNWNEDFAQICGQDSFSTTSDTELDHQRTNEHQFRMALAAPFLEHIEESVRSSYELNEDSSSYSAWTCSGSPGNAYNCEGGRHALLCLQVPLCGRVRTPLPAASGPARGIDGL